MLSAIIKLISCFHFIGFLNLNMELGTDSTLEIILSPNMGLAPLVKSA